jgi:hypothetical protein
LDLVGRRLRFRRTVHAGLGATARPPPAVLKKAGGFFCWSRENIHRRKCAGWEDLTVAVQPVGSAPIKQMSGPDTVKPKTPNASDDQASESIFGKLGEKSRLVARAGQARHSLLRSNCCRESGPLLRCLLALRVREPGLVSLPRPQVVLRQHRILPIRSDRRAQRSQAAQREALCIALFRHPNRPHRWANDRIMSLSS